MSKSMYSDPEIEKIVSINGNNKCVDCGSEDPQWASLNNSVFVCLNCAGIHRNLGINVSFIRSLVMDSWDDKQLKLLFLGGNYRFMENLEEYGVVKDSNEVTLNPDKIEKKYLYKASQYYRELLQAELNLESAPQKPNTEEGNMLIVDNNDLTKDINNKYMGDFDNYENNDNNNDVINNRVVNENNYEQPGVEVKKEKKGFFGKVGSFFNKAADETKKTYKKVEEKVSKMEIKKKLKETGEKTVVLAKEGGHYIADKATQVKNSEFVNRVGTGAKEGFNSGVSKVKGLFTKKNNGTENNVNIENIEESDDYPGQS